VTSQSKPRALQDGRRAAGEATRARIIRTAGRLFARKGIDAVPVREITLAAQVNTAAIHYHFGSKQGLVKAIVEDWAAELAGRRSRWLRRLEASPAPELREVVAALVYPIAELAADRRRGGRDYVAFLSAVLSDPEYMSFIIDAYEEQTARELAALERVTPHLTRPERMIRFSLAKDLINRTLGNGNGPVQLWLDRHVPAADLPEELVAFITGAFAQRP
jgi:AcrR family transcriptional regulator